MGIGWVVVVKRVMVVGRVVGVSGVVGIGVGERVDRKGKDDQ